MFLNGVELAARRLGTARIVGEGRGGCVLVRETGWHPDEISVLADPNIQEIASVIVFGHLDLLPGNLDLIPLPGSMHRLRRVIKPSGGDPQAHILHNEQY